MSEVQGVSAAPATRPKGHPRKSTLLTRNLDAVRYFDELPDSAGVSIHTICAVEQCSVQTGWRRIKAGVWPKPLQIGGQTRIVVGDYRAMRARQQAAAAPAPEAIAEPA